MNKYNKTWWRICLTVQLLRFGYYKWTQLLSAWDASGGDWIEYWESETHPCDAVIEDLGYE